MNQVCYFRSMRKLQAPSLLLFILILTHSCQQTDKEPTIIVSTPMKDKQLETPPLPKEMDLFGEKILIDNFDMQERLDKELIVNTYFHSSTVQILKRSNRYFPQIEAILAEEKLPDDMKYLCVIESALSQATSPAGARGFWQFMPEAGAEYNLEISDDVDERLHIEKSTRAACAYLKNARRNFKTWMLAAASYNCGIGGLKSSLAEQKTNSFFDLYLNGETSRYIFRIMALKLMMENPKGYGYDPDKLELYSPIETRKIEVTKSISDLTAWAKMNGSNLRILKVLNPWLISNKLTVKGKTYTIELPKN